MSSPDWMPLNVADYLTDTDHLSLLEHGAYLLLIMRYWKDGGLPTDERMVARYAHMTSDQWRESRDVIAAFFDEGWRHRRIDAELAKAAEIIGKRKAAGQQRASKSSAHAEHVDSISSYPRVPPLPVPEPQEDNFQAQHSSTPRGRAELDRIDAVCRKAAGLADSASPSLLNLAPIIGLLDAGHDLELDVVPTLRELGARAKRPPSTWEYFTEAIRETSARRRAVAGSGLAPPQASQRSGRPKTAAEAMFEIGKAMRNEQGGNDRDDAGSVPRIGLAS